MSDSSGSEPDTIVQAEPNTPKEARIIIEDIQFRNGYFDPRDKSELAKTSPEYRKRVRRGRKLQRQTLAQYTKKVSTQLYSSKFRFIYEMIQNSHDATFSTAQRKRKQSFVRFEIHPKELLVVSNQNPFEVRNVQAICRTGESSKHEDLESIGEKGFGFKSVFGVANQVHIQSGHWSFRFEHNKGDDGIGMVMPWWTEPDRFPINTNTTFKLVYAEQNKTMLDELMTQFARVPETVILFLKDLQKLEIVYADVEYDIKTKIFQKIGSFEDGRVSIVTDTDGVDEEHRYRIVTRHIVRMPEDEERRGRTNSSVSLAFPVGLVNEQPIISERGQHVFAFLPLQRLPQIPFLIQADFLTSASRESLPECSWNLALRSGVAEAFRQAVEEFCQDSTTLLYSWMRYLPVSQIEAFWEPLYLEIKDLLTECKMLKSTGGTRLKSLSELRMVPSVFLHEDQPLFDDLKDDVYISSTYTQSDQERLRDIGLGALSWEDMLDRLEADLDSPSSKMKYTELEDDWHTAVTTLIEEILVNDVDDEFRERLSEFDVIPLQSGDWTSPATITADDKIYFPGLDEDLDWLLIPQDLGLRVVHPHACVDSERKTIYTSLGVSDCDRTTVVDRILGAHSVSFSGKKRHCQSHFEVLFWSGQKLTWVQRFPLRAISRDGCLRFSSTLFFPSKEDYHTEKLLEFSNLHDIPDCHFIRSDYLASKMSTQFYGKRSWEGWLEEVAGVRYYPRLFKSVSNSASLNPVLEAVLCDNPSQFVPTLQAHWISSYKAACRENPDLRSSVEKCEVLCRNGTRQELHKTFLPTPTLMLESRRFRVESQIPLLRLGEGEDPLGDKDWSFLGDYGVCSEPNLTFYFAVLVALQGPHKTQQCDIGMLTDLYKEIGRIANFDSLSRLQLFFLEFKAIYVPGGANQWHDPRSCLWDGPHFLHQMRLLKSHYGANPEVTSLFVNYLEIHDAIHKHLVNELVSIRCQSLKEDTPSGPLPDVKMLAKIYECLEQMVDSEDTWDTIRKTFKRESLIFAAGKWHNPSQCVWNSPVNISGRVRIHEPYPDLQHFFVDNLHVKIADLKMLIEEILILELLPEPLDVSEVKSITMAAGEMLGQGPNVQISKESLRSLKITNFLPVRSLDGSLSLARSDAEFFINDHDRFAAAFKNKLKFLDFGCDELISLHPLFECLKLNQRYLSINVQSETRVGRSTENRPLTEDFRRRSYALCCCAIFHRGRKFLHRNDEASKMLLGAQILASSDLWTKLIVRQGSKEVEASSDRALIKVEEIDNHLRLYLPEDPDTLKSCYRSQLPAQLMLILGIDNPGAEKQIYRLLTEPNTQLQKVMEEEDIPEVPWLCKLPVLTQAAESTHAPLATPLEIIRRVTNPGVARENLLSPVEIPARQTFELALDASPRTLPSDEYCRLLERVVKQARRSDSEFPGADDLSMTALRQALDDVPILPLNIRNVLGLREDQLMSFEDNAKIGAAGELFVFEKLRKWGMPRFERRNWQSGIRHHVKVHSEYHDLEPWNMKEVADIMYEDTTSEMELFLREHSYNEFPEWADSDSSNNGEETGNSGTEGDGQTGTGQEGHSEDEGAESEGVGTEEDLEGDLDEGSDEGLGEEFDEVEERSESVPEDNLSGSDESADQESDETYEEEWEGFDDQHSGEVTDEFGEEEVSESSYIVDEIDWNQPIEYRLEVKTTVGKCDTVLFVSRNQYQQMKRHTLEDGRRPQTVYVLVRVFNLLSDAIDMRIFVDPYSLRHGTLEFKGGEWQVFPKTGSAEDVLAP